MTSMFSHLTTCRDSVHYAAPRSTPTLQGALVLVNAYRREYLHKQAIHHDLTDVTRRFSDHVIRIRCDDVVAGWVTAETDKAQPAGN